MRSCIKTIQYLYFTAYEIRVKHMMLSNLDVILFFENLFNTLLLKGIISKWTSGNWSITTRIETRSRWWYPRITSYASGNWSITTRIETEKDSHIIDIATPPETDPSQQGLKHSKGYPVKASEPPPETDPSQQGLKPNNADTSPIPNSLRKLIHHNKDWNMDDCQGSHCHLALRKLIHHNKDWNIKEVDVWF